MPTCVGVIGFTQRAGPVHIFWVVIGWGWLSRMEVLGNVEWAGLVQDVWDGWVLLCGCCARSQDQLSC